MSLFKTMGLDVLIKYSDKNVYYKLDEGIPEKGC